MEPFSFNELPEVVRLLFEKVESIEQILQTFKPAEAGSEDLLNLEEAAKFLKISEASLYTKVSRKEVPFSKPGKRLYFSRAALQQWVIDASYKTAKDIHNQLGNSRSKYRSKLI